MDQKNSGIHASNSQVNLKKILGVAICSGAIRIEETVQTSIFLLESPCLYLIKINK